MEAGEPPIAGVPASPAEEPVYKADAEQLQLAFAAVENNNYDEAFAQFRSLALMGDATAQYQLGSFYYQGLGTQRDYYEAARWYRRAAEQGTVDAQYSLGNMYLMGEGIQQDDKQAASWYEKAAAQGHASARHNLENLERVTRAESETMVTYKGEAPEQVEQEVEGKPVEKKSRFGFIKNLFKKDSETAVAGGEQGVTGETATHTAAAPEAVSATETAAAPPDTTAVPDTSESGAEAGAQPNTEKQGFFSRWFGKDKDVGDEEQAAQPETVAMAETASSSSPVEAVSSTAVSDYETGNAYSFGEGVTRDNSEAFKWYLKAAQQGYAPAQYKVGSAYAYGDGVEKDSMEATNWYRQAAQQGYTLAQRNLAMMYSSGTGIQQDKALALAWYSILADKGNVMDIRRRDMLESELTETERARARDLKENIASYIKPGDE
jgi:hypothetical protein